MAAVLSLGGLIAFAIFCRAHYRDPLAFMHIENEFGRGIKPWGPFVALVRFNVDPDYFLVTFSFVVVCVWMLRAAPLWLTVSSWFLLLLPMGTGTLKAMIRYQGANVPALVGAALAMKSGSRFRFLLLASLSLMALEAFLFGSGIGHY
ncbi:MAG: hypothetical protein E6J78_17130 [Deltaproteobacteria bacterium]|nr:MAG: hypothetical protein E6J78_17130 [Deltaproteobacteria bacterium]